MFLLEGLSTVFSLNGQLISVEFDCDVVWSKLLHVEGQLVFVSLLDFEKNGCLGCLGGGRNIVFSLVNLVVHLLWRRRRHWRGGHRVLRLLTYS